MSEGMAEQIWRIVGAYLGCGVVIGLFIALFALKRVDPSAAPTPFRVRLLILPGMAALWPLVISRLAGARAKEDQP
jgi:hypothetical protein